MKTVSAEIESKMDMSEVKSAGTLVIGTVEGDVHDIGKGIVASLVKTNGVEVFDLGREVPAKDFVDAAIEHNAEFVGSSALLTDYNDSTERHRRSSERSWYQRQSKDHDRRSACNQSLGRKDRC